MEYCSCQDAKRLAFSMFIPWLLHTDSNKVQRGLHFGLELLPENKQKGKTEGFMTNRAAPSLSAHSALCISIFQSVLSALPHTYTHIHMNSTHLTFPAVCHSQYLFNALICHSPCPLHLWLDNQGCILRTSYWRAHLFEEITVCSSSTSPTWCLASARTLVQRQTSGLGPLNRHFAFRNPPQTSE